MDTEMIFNGARDGNGNKVPVTVPLDSETKLVLSKINAKTYLATIKEKIKESGNIDILFSFVEVIKFFDKINELIKGNSQATNPEDREGDKEFKSMVMDAITPYGKEGYKTPRGAKFNIMENAGTVYHYENCNDPYLIKFKEALEMLNSQIKERQEFLKTVPSAGLEIYVGEGELITVYPPYKTSTTTYKVTLPR